MDKVGFMNHRIRIHTMYDDMDRLRAAKVLSNLLAHYAELATPDRQAWQDRVQELHGAEPRDLIKLHGELLAFGWLEQNTGATPVLKRGFAPACYRITSAGVRAVKQLHMGEPQAVSA